MIYEPSPPVVMKATGISRKIRASSASGIDGPRRSKTRPSSSAAAAVPLSSVRQPREELGRTAMELLLGEIGSRDRAQHRLRQVVFEPELVARESTASH